MHPYTLDLDRPLDLFDSEEQDEPLAGQDHRDTIDSLYYPLRGRLAAVIAEPCFVAAELRVHRDPNNLRDYREPDILVALGVADQVRPRYDLWVEGKAPDVVIEVLSPSSAENGDLVSKRDWYRANGIREYVVLDPSGRFAPEPRMQAWRLGTRADGSDDRHRMAAPGETLWSELIPFGWRVVDDWVRVVDQGSGELFPPIWAVEPQLRQEIALRRAAQEEAQTARDYARSAQEYAQLSQENTRMAQEHAEQAQADAQAALDREQAALDREQEALERERLALERAEQEAAARRALEEELARLRKEQP